MERLGYQSYQIVENRQVALNVYRLKAEGPTGMAARPGQFAQIKAPGYFLPRPLSICDWTPSRLIFLYKAIGGGTQALSQAHPGERLEILAGLGNGFDEALAGENPLLVGGGLGAAPLYALARRLAVKGRVTVALGFQGARDVILAEEFSALGAKVLLTTVEGDAGQPGLVTQALEQLPAPSQVYACGPEPMLRAVRRLYPQGWYSLEGRMACGVGACMGCTIETASGPKRVCADGPVFKGEELLW